MIICGKINIRVRFKMLTDLKLKHSIQQEKKNNIHTENEEKKRKRKAKTEN